MKRTILILSVLVISGLLLANPSLNSYDDQSNSQFYNSSDRSRFFDDFESYTAGDFLCTQSPDWNPWSNTPGGSDDAYVSESLFKNLIGFNSLANFTEFPGEARKFGFYVIDILQVAVDAPVCHILVVNTPAGKFFKNVEDMLPRAP